MRRTTVLCAALALAGACGTTTTAPLIGEAGALVDEGDNAGAAVLLDSARACIDGGTGPMGIDDGDPSEGPAHEVTLDSFCLHRYEVTNVQYAAFVADTAARAPDYWGAAEPPSDALLRPVVGVAWDNADAYCRSIGGRLPTEAEWERACRGPNDRRYPWGNEWNARHVQIAAVAIEHPDEGWPGALGSVVGGDAFLPDVGALPDGATSAGVYGLADGAMEWVADWYEADAYSTLPASNPIATGPTWDHVVRGLAWLFPNDRPDDIAGLARCTTRNASHAIASARIGFRCAFDGDG